MAPAGTGTAPRIIEGSRDIRLPGYKGGQQWLSVANRIGL